MFCFILFRIHFLIVSFSLILKNFIYFFKHIRHLFCVLNLIGDFYHLQSEDLILILCVTPNKSNWFPCVWFLNYICWDFIYGNHLLLPDSWAHPILYQFKLNYLSWHFLIKKIMLMPVPKSAQGPDHHNLLPSFLSYALLNSNSAVE